MLYNPVEVHVPARYHEIIKKTLQEKKKNLSVKVKLGEPGNDTMLLTRGQIAKMERARILGKKTMTIRMSHNQVQKNLLHEGGFLGMLIAALSAALPSIISAASAAAPAIAASVATGAITGVVSHLVSGNGLYFRKNGLCAKIEAVKGGGIYLTPHKGDGLYLAAPHDSDEEEGGGFLYENVDEDEVKKKRNELQELLKQYAKGDRSNILGIKGAAAYLFVRRRMTREEYDKINEKLGDGLYLKHGGKTYGQLSKSPWIKEQVPMLEILL